MIFWTMKIFNKIDIGFWTGFLAILVGVAWLLYGIIWLRTFFIYPLALIIFGLLAVIKFDSGISVKRPNKNILDDDSDLLEEEL